MDLELPPLDDLDEKVKTIFPMKIVRKSVVKAIQELKRFPDFVSEFLISQYIDSDGNIAEDALNEILADLKKYSPEKGEKEQIKSMAMELGNIDLIDHYQAYADLRKGKYFTQINAMDERATINRDLLQPRKFQDMLKSGLWGKASLQYIKKGDAASLNMNDFQSYQSTGALLKQYIKNREDFSTEEWIDLLIRSIGFKPARFNRTQKLAYLARLIPLVESQLNSLELGPAGTGKSYVYENLSEYARMLVGAEISSSKLIFNQNTHQNGLVFQKDVICFDEVNKGHSAFLEVVPKLQQIMASGRVERYDMEAMTDVSLVFQGNIKFTVRSGKTVPQRDDFLEHELPVSMYDCAFLDRIHLFIHGWEFPVYDPEMINTNFGLISNYMGQILHKLRREDTSSLIRSRVKFFRVDPIGAQKPVTARDFAALNHVISGYIKLIYPHKKITDEEIEEIAQIVVHLRQNVIDQMVLIEPNQARTLGFAIIPSEQIIIEENKDAKNQENEQESSNLSESTEIDNGQNLSDEPEELIIENEEEIPNEIEATTIEVSSDLENVVEMPILKINNEDLLTEKIPYWVMKYLVGNGQLTIKEGHLKLDKTQKDFPHSIQSIPPLPKETIIHGKTIEYEAEEQNLCEIVRKVATLNEKLHRILDVLGQRKDFEFRAIRLHDNTQGLEILKKLNNIDVNPDITKINQSIENLTKIKDLIEKSAGNSPDLLYPEYYGAVETYNQLISELDLKIEYWHDLKNKIDDELNPLKREILKLEEASGKTEDVLFNGQKFTLFSIDVNNILKRYFDKTGLHGNDSLRLITEKYFPPTPYLALFFASKYHEPVKNSFPECESLQWFIESNIKHDKDGKPKYADIDSLLTGVTGRFIAEHHDQISEIYLGSGDKDLHVVLDTAKDFSIPITVIAVSQDSLANELFAKADYVDFLWEI